MTAPTAPDAPPVLRPRRDDRLADRLGRSAAAATAGHHLRTDEVATWLDERRRAHHFRVDRIPFADLDGWSFESTTGNLVHRSGRFFTVEGLDVTVGRGPTAHHWQQPVINQPEVGILGILAKEFDGILHFLMQAKMEPGNPNLLQLSPTVQATRSNYTKVHQGSDVKYLDHFTDPRRARVLADTLQSEHGSWFYRKANRNVVVETDDDVPLDDDFCWLTLGQIGRLLQQSNTVNMDARTVLACVPVAHDESHALHSDTELRSWITRERSRHDLHAHRIPLAHVTDWTRDAETISHDQGRYFKVTAVSVQAGNREVPGWTQPLFEPVGLGITAFAFRHFSGVPHLLAHARVEAGFLDTVELGPTVQYTPDNFTHLTGDDRPLFLDAIRAAPPNAIRYESVHAEEGGRFLNAESRYLLVDADAAGIPGDPPPGYRWTTPGQFTHLLRHGHYVNVQARTLLAVLNSGSVTL
ncbi:NDP-hexose 2,3-dehydratase family protein [Streptomyces exfoliatus]|uniref:NDP-hexose 2,3-dehydratase family protein n=1 Tax=Streptomyces exfoliatus TaxID=1905 RepID=UPI0004C7FCCA|nr:NDP-hexose 2,3-dehydratase family protein [Streptomyces exfoliatus]